jgi:hypothetical protein
MNCKPGDLAVIVRSMAGNEGVVVSIVGPAHEELPGFLGCLSRIPECGHLWHCRATRPIPADIGTSDSEFAFPDAWLRPIRDPGDDATDETLLWLPSPSREKEAA